MSILQGRQIFSHLEGQKSLPASLYSLAIQQARLRRRGYNKISKLFFMLPYNFGQLNSKPIYEKINKKINKEDLFNNYNLEKKKISYIHNEVIILGEIEYKQKEKKVKIEKIKKSNFNIKFK